MDLMRTYWQGASGTYCDICYWGTLAQAEDGLAEWVDHCKVKHPHVVLDDDLVRTPSAPVTFQGWDNDEEAGTPPAPIKERG